MAELVDLIQTRTRQFAKRQHTWFRNLEECIAVPTDGTETAAEIADRIVAGPMKVDTHASRTSASH
jgi:tRNA dimethylallyltransferase